MEKWNTCISNNIFGVFLFRSNNIAYVVLERGHGYFEELGEPFSSSLGVEMTNVLLWMCIFHVFFLVLSDTHISTVYVIIDNYASFQFNSKSQIF